MIFLPIVFLIVITLVMRRVSKHLPRAMCNELKQPHKWEWREYTKGRVTSEILTCAECGYTFGDE